MHLADRRVVVAQFASAAPLAAAGGGALQVAEDDVKDVDHIVAGAAGEHVHVGGQGGGPPLWSQVGQLGGPGLVGVAGRGHDPRGRDAGQVQVPGAEGTNPLQAFQGADQAGDGGGERWLAQQVQLRAALSLGDQQQFLQPGGQLRARRGRQSAVDPAGGAFPHRSDQAGQHAVPGEQDLAGQQLAVGGAEQRRGCHLVDPRLPVQPRQEGEPPGLGGEVPVPVAVPDLGGVPPPHRHVPVAGQHLQVIDAELACHGGHDRLRYRGLVRLERADRPDGDQLGRISQLGHRVGPAPDHRQVRRAQMAHPPQPVPVQLNRKLGIRGDAGSIRCYRHARLRPLAAAGASPQPRWPRLRRGNAATVA